MMNKTINKKMIANDPTASRVTLYKKTPNKPKRAKANKMTIKLPKKAAIFLLAVQNLVFDFFAGVFFAVERFAFGFDLLFVVLFAGMLFLCSKT